MPDVWQRIVFRQKGNHRAGLLGASRGPKRRLQTADLPLDFESLRFQIIGQPAHGLPLLIGHFRVVVQVTADVFQFAGVAIDSLAGAVFECFHVRAVHDPPLESQCVCIERIDQQAVARHCITECYLETDWTR